MYSFIPIVRDSTMLPARPVGLAADRHNTDARTRAARPTNIDEFQEWWGSVSDVSDGRCTPHPRKLETEMEPD